MTPTGDIFEDFHRRLRAFVSRRVRNADVDDVLQETFLRIHRHLGAVRRADRLAAWVFQIARNVIADHYRRDRVDGRIVGPPPTGEDEETPVEVTEGLAQIAACVAPMIASLPRSDRVAVQMTDIEGLTQREASRRAAVTFSGMKSRVQRARQKLKGLILECCRIELDRRGRIIDYEPRKAVCEPGGGCQPSPSRRRPEAELRKRGGERRA